MESGAAPDGTYDDGYQGYAGLHIADDYSSWGDRLTWRNAGVMPWYLDQQGTWVADSRYLYGGYWKDGDGLVDVNQHYGGGYVNGGDPAWKKFVVYQVDKIIHDGEFDGVFLDTVDTPDPVGGAGPSVSWGPRGNFGFTAEGMVELVEEIKAVNPAKIVAANRGYWYFNPDEGTSQFADRYRHAINIFVTESWYYDAYIPGFYDEHAAYADNWNTNAASPSYRSRDNFGGFWKDYMNAQANRPDGFNDLPRSGRPQRQRHHQGIRQVCGRFVFYDGRSERNAEYVPGNDLFRLRSERSRRLASLLAYVAGCENLFRKYESGIRSAASGTGRRLPLRGSRRALQPGMAGAGRAVRQPDGAGIQARLPVLRRRTRRRGNLDLFRNANFGGQSVKFTVPSEGPLITNVQASAIGDTSATVTWTTDGPATSIVRYGIVSPDEQQLSDTSAVTQHSIVLQDLAPGTTYRYRVSSADAEGRVSESAEYAFTTTDANPPPQLSNISVVSIGSDTATVRWNTNQPARSEVQYGLTPSYGMTAQSQSLVTAHEVELTGLSPDTQYHFRVRSVNAAGIAAVSGNGSFRTAPLLSYPSITIDGDASDWSGIPAAASGSGTTGVHFIKAAHDGTNLYLLAEGEGLNTMVQFYINADITE